MLPEHKADALEAKKKDDERTAQCCKNQTK
jgi:hypothetical protein